MASAIEMNSGAANNEQQFDDTVYFGPAFDDKCPTCGAKVVMICKCMIGDRVCENGHKWYRNSLGQPIQGSGHANFLRSK